MPKTANIVPRYGHDPTTIQPGAPIFPAGEKICAAAPEGAPATRHRFFPDNQFTAPHIRPQWQVDFGRGPA
jgi:hypothetical protein